MPKVRPTGPLNEQDGQNLKMALRALQDAEEQIARATRSGYDCTEHAGLCASLKQRLEAISREYFGGPPR